MGKPRSQKLLHEYRFGSVFQFTGSCRGHFPSPLANKIIRASAQFIFSSKPAPSAGERRNQKTVEGGKAYTKLSKGNLDCTVLYSGLKVM